MTDSRTTTRLAAGVVRRACLTALYVLSASLVPYAAKAAESAAETEQQALVRKALTRMKPDLRSVLVLRYFAELDSKEIGKMLELPDATVRSRLRAARRELAEELKRAGYHHEDS